jgi:hypothetical protein
MSSASQRLESLKNQVLYSGPATGKEDIARERANTSFDIESMKRFWAGGQESYDAMVSNMSTECINHMLVHELNTFRIAKSLCTYKRRS